MKCKSKMDKLQNITLRKGQMIILYTTDICQFKTGAFYNIEIQMISLEMIQRPSQSALKCILADRIRLQEERSE